MKKILVLGTGAAQSDLIQACKQRGWTVYACSSRVGDKGEKYVDYFENINIVDKNAIKQYASDNDVDLIYSAGSDIAMPVVFSVSEELGLYSFCKAETAEICNNKSLLRERLGKDYKGNIPFQTVETSDEKIEIPYPFMMKPIDSQGQRGVYRVENHEEYLSRFDKCMEHSRRKKLILESYIEGSEISVNTFSENGKMSVFIPSDRIVWEGYTGGLIHKHVLPGRWINDFGVLAKIRDLVERTLFKLEIKEGPAYFQIMVNKMGNPYLIEGTPRLDGCHMWRLIRYSTGIDLMNMTVNALEGTHTETTEYETKPFITEFFCQAPGKIFHKKDFDIRPHEYIEWYYNEGDIVRKMNGYKEKVGYCIMAQT